jgi:hypothetical protein
VMIALAIALGLLVAGAAGFVVLIGPAFRD